VPDLFGPIFVPSFLEQAVIDTLKLWLPTYLAEVELQLEREQGLIEPPRSYTTRRRFEKFPEDQIPTCVVVSPGLANEPHKEGDGSHRAEWALGVGVIVSAPDQESTNLVAKIYGAAIRACLLQKSSLGGVASGITWYDESYDDLPSDDTARTLGAAALYFRVEVEDIVNSRVGPNVPTPPGTQWGVAETVTVTIEKEDEL
jgi:hypothetical protein